MKYNKVCIAILLFMWGCTALWAQNNSIADAGTEDEESYSLAVVPLIFYKPTITSVVARDVLNDLRKTMPQEIQSRVIVGSASPSEKLSELYDYYFLALDFDFVVLVELRDIDVEGDASSAPSGSDDTDNLVNYQLGMWIFTRGYTSPIYTEVFTVEILESVRRTASLSTLKINERVQDIEETFVNMTDVLKAVLEKSNITVVVNKDSRRRPSYFIRTAGAEDLYPDVAGSVVTLEQSASSVDSMDIYQIVKGKEQYIATYPINSRQKYYTLEVPFIVAGTPVQSFPSSIDQLFGGQLPLYSNKPSIFLGGFALLTRYRYSIVKNTEDVIFPYVGAGLLVTYAQTGVDEDMSAALQFGLSGGGGLSFMVRDENQFTVGANVGMLVSGSPKGYVDSTKNSSLLPTVSIDSGYTRYIALSDKWKLRIILDLSLLFAAGSVNATPSEDDVVLNTITKEEELVLYMVGHGFLGIGFQF